MYDDITIERIARGLIDRTLPKAEWTHAAHFAAALWLRRYRPELAVPEAFEGLIRRYNEATGTPNTGDSGYHHTITLASLRAVSAHLGRYSEETALSTILAGLLASPFGRSDWLLDYWNRARLFGRDARREWIAPDRAPLPF